MIRISSSLLCRRLRKRLGFNFKMLSIPGRIV
jgi:hypothetical protein